jgi:CheY-like chemotaxis protein
MATVLLVDDEPDIREALRRTLEASGHDVLEVENGVEALHVLQYAAQPLVVLLDLHMPLLGGAGVLGAVAADKHLAARNRYLLMTAHGRSIPLPLANLLIHLHVPVVAKPFDVEQMVAMVAAAAHTLPAR